MTDLRDVVLGQLKVDAVGGLPWTPYVDSGLELVVEDGADEGRVESLDRGFIMLGRMQTPGERRAGWLLFQEKSVSRAQAILSWNVRENTYNLFCLAGARNPTRVGMRSADAARSEWQLRPGDRVTMGRLAFKLRKRALDTPGKFVSKCLNMVGVFPQEESFISNDGLALTVTHGPDEGRTFILTKGWHVVGRGSRSGSDPSTVRLTDPEVESEHLALIWVAKGGRYTLLHNAESHSKTVVHKVPADHMPAQTIKASADDPVYLVAGDSIEIGQSRLVLHKEMSVCLEEALFSAQRNAQSWARKTPREGGTSTRITPVSMADAEAAQTLKWRPAAEWMVELIQRDGSAVEIPILPGSLSHHRTLYVGPLGERPNNIVLNDPHLPNQAARLEFEDNRWFLIAESDEFDTAIAGQPVVRGEKRLLQPGSEIRMGDTKWRVVRRVPTLDLPEGHAYVIEVVSAPGVPTGARMSVDRTEVTVGRDPSCDVVLNDASVSRCHAAVVMYDQSLWLRPLSGTNPTFVNGVRAVQELPLNHGDEIQLSRDSIIRLVALHAEVF